MSDATSQSSTGGFDMLQKMWEAFSPSAAFQAPLSQLMQQTVPLVDPAELDKRIAEMRAVEQWLTLNANMLRSTIQAFEVQRATYATLKAFGESFTQAAPRASASTAAGAKQGDAKQTEKRDEAKPEAGDGNGDAATQVPPFFANTAAYGAFDPAPWWNALRAQFEQIAAAAQAAAPAMPPNPLNPKGPSTAASGGKAGGRPRARRNPGDSSGATPSGRANDTDDPKDA